MDVRDETTTITCECCGFHPSAGEFPDESGEGAADLCNACVHLTIDHEMSFESARAALAAALGNVEAVCGCPLE